MASTDQGDVSYELPCMHALYRIDSPPGVGNHIPGFAEVSHIISRLTARSIEAYERTITCAKSLAWVAIDFLGDSAFREESSSVFW
jgi:hypothetical protein